MSKLSIWILEDYGTNNKWTLKHTISLCKLFGKTKKQMGYFDFELFYIGVIVHQNGIWFSLLGLGWKEPSSHITWTTEKFTYTLHSIW